MDTLTRRERSALMAKVKARGTRPESIVADMLLTARYRFTRHDADLPGTPDFVLPRRRLVIFVHGCFWHAHSCRRGRSMPTTRRPFWEVKKKANQTRDRRSRAALRRLGYRVLVLWECRLKDKAKVMDTIRAAASR